MATFRDHQTCKEENSPQKALRISQLFILTYLLAGEFLIVISLEHLRGYQQEHLRQLVSSTIAQWIHLAVEHTFSITTKGVIIMRKYKKITTLVLP
jgi:hypothetical protein